MYMYLIKKVYTLNDEESGVACNPHISGINVTDIVFDL